ncbi:cystathionine beta-lyase [Saprolegnia diclina VS20]|uniref:cysteine-S-conjugate beta-lyase n=1 Tax=Saprolegnia diclina (strain VS20) TaxID=1156394 RepID=T0RNJ3_SAPDV|nr:cystathionine beta-lyase [Saprolegnia diclina VS20]EQC33943.1 cystathionine beta-lyase [Saprolegnia diclina VS20]|eukprot:XP_008612738.1 cystathionine beta-lyase [Saprolegnia diclina VS20]
MSSVLQQSLGEDEVFELVCDYLRTRKFYQAEQALVHERDQAAALETPAPKNQVEPAAPSKLESLLERSYVTGFASGELPPSPKPAHRTNLDGNDISSAQLSESEDDDEAAYGFSTKLVAFEACKDDPHGSATMPIYQTSTFAQKSATEFGAYDYTRSGNPTRAALERQMAEIEHGHRAFAFTSGMAALAAISRLAKAGDHIVLSDDSYGGTYRLLSKLTARNGVHVKYVDLSGHDGPANLRAAINTETKLVMMESPTNPMQRICNIPALATVAHKFGALLSVDNTMMSPILQNPLVLGADICMHSATKFICGHSDTMSGIVIAKDPELCRELYFVQNAEGTGLAPMDCWLLLRGIKTMGLRVLTAQENAMRVAAFLSNHPAVTKVFYAGLPTANHRDIHYAQARGAGSVITFCTGNLAFSQHVVSTTKLFKITVSFGSVNSLISLPGVMSHASIPEEVRKARSFPEDLVRLSIGIEDVQDLINDLQRAFQSFTAQ